MDAKNIKMRRQNISSFEINKKDSNSARARGEYAEQKVYEHFLKQGYQLLLHRKKLFGVEFDLIFQGSDHLIYVEVKSVRSPDFYLLRWPRRQKQRFLRVAAVLAEKYNSKYFLALVDYKDKVHLFNAGSEI